MNQDYKDLLSAFHADGVRYLIVGGYAVIFHAQPRFTRTSTFSYKRTPATRRRHMRRLPGLAYRSKAFAEPGSFFRFGQDQRGFDILLDISGVDFDGAWERRVEGVIDATTGLKAFFISSADLVAAKLAS